jgi:hypothetical protein
MSVDFLRTLFDGLRKSTNTDDTDGRRGHGNL